MGWEISLKINILASGPYFANYLKPERYILERMVKKYEKMKRSGKYKALPYRTTNLFGRFDVSTVEPVVIDEKLIEEVKSFVKQEKFIRARKTHRRISPCGFSRSFYFIVNIRVNKWKVH
jgi:hypothetical protein